MNMLSGGDRIHRLKIAQRILGEANDLKRTPAALAADLGWAPTDVDRVLAGEASDERTRDLLMAMVAGYPVALGDLWVEADDRITACAS